MLAAPRPGQNRIKAEPFSIAGTQRTFSNLPCPTRMQMALQCSMLIYSASQRCLNLVEANPCQRRSCILVPTRQHVVRSASSPTLYRFARPVRSSCCAIVMPKSDTNADRLCVGPKTWRTLQVALDSIQSPLASPRISRSSLQPSCQT